MQRTGITLLPMSLGCKLPISLASHFHSSDLLKFITSTINILKIATLMDLISFLKGMELWQSLIRLIGGSNNKNFIELHNFHLHLLPSFCFSQQMCPEHLLPAGVTRGYKCQEN